MMKNRIEHLEAKNPKPETEADELISIGKDWWNSISPGRDWEAAIEARKRAQPYFENYPEWKQQPPKYCMKMLWIDWFWFVWFLKPDVQAEYKQAAEESRAPGRGSREYHNKKRISK